MATGLEAYDALKESTRGLPSGSAYTVSSLEAHDLQKLTVRDLLSRDYDHQIADEVTAALSHGDLGPLGSSLGLRLSVQ